MPSRSTSHATTTDSRTRFRTPPSSLYKLRRGLAPDGDALARRAQSDFGPIIDAMWGAGYYDAAVTISIDRASLSILSTEH